MVPDHVFNHLQIYDRRERWIVGCAELALKGVAVARISRPRRPGRIPDRILLLRLERIGDLLMILSAITAVRTRAPHAEIDLVVGSWNEPLARLIPDVTRIEVLDASWLAREHAGASKAELIRRAWGWRERRYDLAINFEPDIRSNLLLALSGTSRRIGFSSAGGGPALTEALIYDPSTHTSVNALRLVDAALPVFGPSARESHRTARRPRIDVSDEVRRQARSMLTGGGSTGPMIGIHPSGGRRIKEWNPQRFAQVATQLARAHAATIVLTGTPADRPAVDAVRSALPADVRTLDLTASIDLIMLAGVLEQLTLFVTADTGPMHLAAAVGTPIVAIFGPSDPMRYAPLGERTRVVRSNLWCSPCNRIRRPPARCRNRIPDCLVGIDVNHVCEAANDLLREGETPGRGSRRQRSPERGGHRK